MTKIIANESLTMGEKYWPQVVPTLRLSPKLTNLVRESMPVSDGISLNVVPNAMRSDFVRGEWVCRHPSDGPLYENAGYEDVQIEHGGRTQAVLRVRRVG